MLLLEDFLKTLPKTKTKPPKDTAKAVYLDMLPLKTAVSLLSGIIRRRNQ